MEVSRPSKYGGIKIYSDYETLRTEYMENKLHPLDLKNSVSEALIKILKPVREYFKKNPKPLEKMKKIAQEKNCYLVFGMPLKDEKVEGLIYNSAVLIHPNGKVDNCNKRS